MPTNNLIKTIEKKLNITLPGYYKKTLLNYPFAMDSFANDCLLPIDTKVIFYNNEPEFIKSLPSEDMFVVGGDGGEEVYLIKLSSSKSSVYLYDFETGKVSPKFKDWEDYLLDIKKSLLEIEEDEKKIAEKKKNKKWWQFWI